MTRIWKEAGFVDGDPWVVETEDRKAIGNEKPILPLKVFLERIETSAVKLGGYGVAIRPEDATAVLAPHLDKAALVAVVFPAFSDGRAFSHASLLRSRYAYKGEIRAIGDVLIDQIPLMLRCGIDSFAVSNPTALKRLSEGRLPGIHKHYQPAARDAARAGGYSWRRVPRDAA
jgi:uncharacterized protein (DUF934 family)